MSTSPLDSVLPPAAALSAPHDPVCGMSVNRGSAHHAEVDERLYWFCSSECRARFLANPRHFLAMGTPSEPTMSGRS